MRKVPAIGEVEYEPIEKITKGCKTFTQLIRGFETIGICVFMADKISPDECKAFTIADEVAPFMFINANAKDRVCILLLAYERLINSETTLLASCNIELQEYAKGIKSIKFTNHYYYSERFLSSLRNSISNLELGENEITITYALRLIRKSFLLSEAQYKQIEKKFISYQKIDLTK